LDNPSILFGGKQVNLQTTESHPVIWHGGDVWNHVDHEKLKQREFLDFSSNVNPLGPPRKVLESISENLWRLRHYPEPNSNSLRKVIAERSPSLTWENIVMGNGASELIFLHANAVLREGDQALIPSPTFMEYERAALTINCRIKNAPIDLNCGMNASDILGVLTKDIKIIYLCNPNNPTGRIMPKEDTLQIMDEADKVGAHTLID